MTRLILRRIALSLAATASMVVVALFAVKILRRNPATSGAASAASAPPPGGGTYTCTSDLGCNLNGVCRFNNNSRSSSSLTPTPTSALTFGTCDCDVAWSATPNCSVLRLLPTSSKSGYRPPGKSSWGGSVYYYDYSSHTSSTNKKASDDENENENERDSKRDSKNDDEDGHKNGLYHMYPAELVNHCGLTSWQTNSRIVHATSKTLDGPYEFRDEVLGVWSHNPQLVSVPVPTDHTDADADAGTQTHAQYNSHRTAGVDVDVDVDVDVLMLLSAGYGRGPFGSGMPSPPQNCGPTGCCSNGTSPCGIHRGHPCNNNSNKNTKWPPLDPPDPRARNPLGRYHNVTVLVSPSGSPDGPWVPKLLPIKQLNADADADAVTPHQYTPTGLAFANGTVLLWLVGGGMFRADHWEGTYTRWDDPEEGLQWGCGGGGGGEDPFVYLDARGHWHCLFHAGPYFDLKVAGGHAFSLDGRTWHTTPTPAYRGDVLEELVDDGAGGGGGGGDGTTVVQTRIAKRERPQPVFGKDGTTIVALSTGVCTGEDWHLCNNNPWPGGFDRTFTHVQLVATNDDDDDEEEEVAPAKAVEEE